MKTNRYLQITGVLAALGLLVLLSGFRTKSLNGRDVVDAYLQRHGVDSKIENITMVTLDGKGHVETKEVVRMFMTDSDDNQYSLLRFNAPEAITGVALLSKLSAGKDDEQFLFMPAMEMVRKIAGSSKKGYFMGSDFAYEDLLPENTDRYEYVRGINEYLDDTECYRVTAKSATSEFRTMTGYAKRELWITVDDFRLVRIDFYEREDTLLKTLRLNEFNPISEGSEAMQPSQARMTNHEKKTSSLFAVTKGKYNLDIPQEIFTVEAISDWSAKYNKEVEELLK